MDTLETIISGALGALTLGLYWHYISMKQIEEHNNVSLVTDVTQFQKYL